MRRSKNNPCIALAIVFPALLILGMGDLSAQTLIAPETTVNHQSARPRANERLLIFQKSSDRDVAVFVDTLPAIGGQKNLRIEVSGPTSRTYSLREVSIEPLVLFGPRIVFNRFRNNANRLGWLDLTNGTEREFALNFSPLTVSATSDTIAALGRDATNSIHLALIDTGGEVRSVPFAVSPQRELREIVFSLNAKGEPILIDCTNASFTTLTIDQSLVRETAPTPLSGPEFEYSRSRSQQVNRLKSRIVLGHVPGSQNFLVGPYRQKEGYRLVTVDDQGRQTGSYRLQIAGEGNFVLSPNPLSANSTHVMLTAMDGTVRQYRRPK